jgi:hypothetical protein
MDTIPSQATSRLDPSTRHIMRTPAIMSLVAAILRLRWRRAEQLRLNLEKRG